MKKDTLLTFHIVPKLKTDDYNIALFKCSGPSCMNEIARNKIKPIRVCFSWNTSHNCNTGLSSKQKDTTYMAQGIGVNVGPTYASALKVKAGETYYLLVNANSVNLQDPEGFTIYFYNYLPKNKTNTYIFKTK
ncbi:MAG: hypothetical protein JNM96_07980 [Bacteroidia bacterium]|nr:hypothetical protein [Bacteroidia bacterium]